MWVTWETSTGETVLSCFLHLVISHHRHMSHGLFKVAFHGTSHSMWSGVLGIPEVIQVVELYSSPNVGRLVAWLGVAWPMTAASHRRSWQSSSALYRPGTSEQESRH